MTTDKVTIDRELLERVVKADASNGASSVDLVDGWKAMEQIRSILAASPSAPATGQGDALRPLYTCIGKGGEYRYLGAAIGAGDSRGELVEVYQDENGQLYHRTPEDFMERMEPIAAARKGEGE